MTDWELQEDPLEALSSGDPKPYEGFVRTHARFFFAFFRRRGAGLHRAEDLTQDVFLKLYHHAARYRPESNFEAFCLRTAQNIWIDDRRRAGVRRVRLHLEHPGAEHEALRGGLPEPPDPAPGPLERAHLSEEGRRLRAALQELPETHRAVFELGVLEELRYATIAEILEIPVGTVKSRMYHAVRKLRELAGDHDARRDQPGGFEGETVA